MTGHRAGLSAEENAHKATAYVTVMDETGKINKASAESQFSSERARSTKNPSRLCWKPSPLWGPMYELAGRP